MLVCNIQVLSVDTLVQEAIQAFLKNERKTEHTVIPQEAEGSGEEDEVSILVNFNFGCYREMKYIRKKTYCLNFLLNSKF